MGWNQQGQARLEANWAVLTSPGDGALARGRSVLRREVGAKGTDDYPAEGTNPGRYTGPVPTVMHLHGMVTVGDESDGYPEAWFLPAARNIPKGYARVGTWFPFFSTKAARILGEGWGRGFVVAQYPNVQPASTANPSRKIDTQSAARRSVE